MLFLVTRPKHENICNTIVWQYFKDIYDVTSVTTTTTERYESTLSFPFLLIIYKTTSVTYHFYYFFGKVLALVNSSDNITKS